MTAEGQRQSEDVPAVGEPDRRPALAAGVLAPPQALGGGGQ